MDLAKRTTLTVLRISGFCKNICRFCKKISTDRRICWPLFTPLRKYKDESGHWQISCHIMNINFHAQRKWLKNIFLSKTTHFFPSQNAKKRNSLVICMRNDSHVGMSFVAPRTDGGDWDWFQNRTWTATTCSEPSRLKFVLPFALSIGKCSNVSKIRRKA